MPWKIISSVVWILISQMTFSQDTQHWTEKSHKTETTGMYILGGWSLANITSGLYYSHHTSGEAKAFHQMNIYWNTINLGIASYSLWNRQKNRPTYEKYSFLQEQHQKEKIFLFNAALDISYILGGLYLTEKGKNDPNHSYILKGYGKSLMLQGGFLFLFDVIMYLQIHKITKKFMPLIQPTALSGFEIGFRLYIK